MGKKEGGEWREGEAGCWKRCVCTGPVIAAVFWGFFFCLFRLGCSAGHFCKLCYDLFAVVLDFFLFNKICIRYKLAQHCVSLQKSPAKKLSHALSKSLSCASSREPLHPMFPEIPEKPLNLAHIV